MGSKDMIYLMVFKKETPPAVRPCLPWPWQGLAAWAFLLGTLGIFPLNTVKVRDDMCSGGG